MGQKGSNDISSMSLATSLISFLSSVCLSEGLILDSVLTEVNPSMALELGTYCGYSTVRIARLLSPGSKLITVEFNPAFAAVARQIIAYAGLQDKVRKRTGMQRFALKPFSLRNCTELNVNFLTQKCLRKSYDDDKVMANNLGHLSHLTWKCSRLQMLFTECSMLKTIMLNLKCYFHVKYTPPIIFINNLKITFQTLIFGIKYLCTAYCLRCIVCILYTMQNLNKVSNYNILHCCHITSLCCMFNSANYIKLSSNFHPKIFHPKMSEKKLR